MTEAASIEPTAIVRDPVAVNGSDLNRVMACIGSLFMPKSPAPSLTDNTVRKEGDAIHWLIAQTVAGEGVDVGTMAPSGVKITTDMLKHSAEFFETLSARGATGHHEQECSYVDPLGKYRIDNRADHIVMIDTTLYVDDFKYGWTIVEPVHNWTLIAYALGYIQQTGVAPDTIVFTIHQPRPWHTDGPVRTWTMTISDLMIASNRIRERLTHANASTYTSIHCGKCPANALCPAARKAALNAIDVADAPYREDIPNDWLSAELDLLNRAAAMIKDRLAAASELAVHRITTGQVINGYSIERGLSNRRWIDGITPENLNMMTGITVAKWKIDTPAEAARRGVDKDTIEALTERVSTAPKLVKMDIDKKARKLLR